MSATVRHAARQACAYFRIAVARSIFIQLFNVDVQQRHKSVKRTVGQPCRWRPTGFWGLSLCLRESRCRCCDAAHHRQDRRTHRQWIKTASDKTPSQGARRKNWFVLQVGLAWCCVRVWCRWSLSHHGPRSGTALHLKGAHARVVRGPGTTQHINLRSSIDLWRWLPLDSPRHARACFATLKGRRDALACSAHTLRRQHG